MQNLNVTLENGQQERPSSGGPVLRDTQILEALPSAVCVCDTTGRILRSNAKARLFLGCDPAGSGFPPLYAPDGTPLAFEATPIADAMLTGRSYRHVALSLERPSGLRMAIQANIDAMRDDNGHIIAAIMSFHEAHASAQRYGPARNPDFQMLDMADIPEREGLMVGETRLREVLDVLPTAVYITDDKGLLTYFNQACVELAGRIPRIGLDRWHVSWRLYSADGTPMSHHDSTLARALEGERGFQVNELIAERPDGSRVSLLCYPAPLRDGAGTIVGAVNMLVDITDRKRAEDHRKMLLHELNHRVKNTLTTVQSIAAQSFRGDLRSRPYRWFEGRLLALAKAHDILSRENWEAADLRHLVLQITEPLLGSERERFEIQGPRVRLRPKIALAMSMAMHELCTNAIKYGSLSNDSGCVAIRWEVSSWHSGPRLELCWEERGGPPVVPPRRKGFGTRLIERGLARELNAVVNVSYEVTGIVCTMDTPLDAGFSTVSYMS